MWLEQAINITYTENLDDLNKEYLNMPFDGIIIYANHDSIDTSQEAALLEFVRNGKGLIATLAASHCFRNSAYLAPSEDNLTVMDFNNLLLNI